MVRSIIFGLGFRAFASIAIYGFAKLSMVRGGP